MLPFPQYCGCIMKYCAHHCDSQSLSTKLKTKTPLGSKLVVGLCQSTSEMVPHISDMVDMN